MLAVMPTIKLLREPEGRLRLLSEEEIARLLDVYRRSLNPYLATIVTVAINTGMRQGELMRLRWEDVDVSRGVLMVRKSKSGKRREIPMNEACDAALQPCPGRRSRARSSARRRGPGGGPSAPPGMAPAGWRSSRTCTSTTFATPSPRT